MKNKKTLFIAGIYICVVAVMVVSTLFVINGIKKYVNEVDNYDYTIEGVFDNEEESIVVSKIQNDNIIKPYISDNVKIGKYFYDYKSDNQKQEESIILYKNTYIQNNGVDYIENDPFDIVSILDGEVVSIEENEVYGKTLVIKHNDNIESVYSNIDNVLVSVGYKTTQGEIIAKSRKNELYNNGNYMFHFEVYSKGNAIDPENLYTLKVSDIE